MKLKQTQKKRNRYKPPLQKVLTQFEIAILLLVNFLEYLDAIEKGIKHPIIDWMIVNTSLWTLRVSESANLLCGHINIIDRSPENTQQTLPKAVQQILDNLKADGQDILAEALYSTLVTLCKEDEKTTTSHFGLVNTKNGIPRDVPIGKNAELIIRHYMQWKKAIGEPTDPDSPFFFSIRGKNNRYTIQGLAKAFRRAKTKAGILKPITSHSGRHTIGSHMGRHSKYLQELKSALGHASINTTNQYTHMFNPKMIEFSQEYEKIIYPVMEVLQQKGKNYEIFDGNSLSNVDICRMQ
ncbi:tyrosine-type recombinase/integrase [Candidatus Uabimicrobium sp. HlEnr_7]|uniref:tyrosine-type recombinase/integrase n=1 Tax=Candidatus Uabimicrobium helgolandensis TaxID=3095367 RepID=UPI003558E422